MRWTEEQSAALRKAAGSATNLPLDWENLAEEIEGLGKSLRHELRSRIVAISFRETPPSPRVRRGTARLTECGAR